MFPQRTWSPSNGKDRNINIKKRNNHDHDGVFSIDNVEFKT